MNLIMDADCLIKLTKSHLKEIVCATFKVTMPERVKQEVVDTGAGHPDALVIEKNLRVGALQTSKEVSCKHKGEEAVLALFQNGRYDAVCSDDKKFIRKLRAMDVPYITPAVFIPLLVRKKALTYQEACDGLENLAPFVSGDECAIVKLKLSGMKEKEQTK